MVYLPENDRRMLSAYRVMREVFDRAWSLVNPPFEQVKIPYHGEILEGHFYPVRGKVGRSPVIFNYSGADGILIRGTAQRGSQYLKRGIAFFDVDAPGHGGSLRLKKLCAPPDSERVSRAVIDYLVTRPDVDPDRIALHGSSMGGYSGPRCATDDKRIKALAVLSGAFSLREDIFDFYPPIQDRLRWLIGSTDSEQGRREIGNFTLEGIAHQIECPMLIGYNKDDRIMDPRGALRLYQEATNSNREMLEGGESW